MVTTQVSYLLLGYRRRTLENTHLVTGTEAREVSDEGSEEGAVLCRPQPERVWKGPYIRK